MIYNYKYRCTTFYNYLRKLNKLCAELKKVSDLNGEKIVYDRKERISLLVKKQKLPKKIYVFDS